VDADARGAGRGANSVQQRIYNERFVLQRLRRAGEASKADLARDSRLTHTAVGSIVGSLVEAGLVHACGRRVDGARGQPASLFRLNPKGAFGVGVRLDRTRIETAVVDLSGCILASRSHDMLLPDPERALEIVREDTRSVLRILRPAERARLAGIGLGQPYHLGRWLSELDLRADFGLWEQVDFAAMLRKALRRPVFSENDGNAAAIAELLFGVGQTESDFLYLFLGPAVGGGAVIGGESLRGHCGNAADVGMLPVPHSLLASAPQARGPAAILLARASLNVLTRHLRHCGLQAAGRAELQQAYEGGHPAVGEWLDDCVEALVHAVRAAVSVLDVPVCVIDTDIEGDFVIELMRRLALALGAIEPELRIAPRLVRGSFGPDASALGAASLPMFFNFAPRHELLRGEPAIAPSRAVAGGPKRP
jgi:predicted NBD/HSP70 family sugar kinase